MTISITPDKIVELRAMLTHCCSPAARLTLKGLESVAGFWVFCQDCLPLALKTFMLSTFTWMRELRHKHQSVRHGKSYLAYVPRTVKKDVRLILGVLPLCNGKQPLQPLRGKPWQRPLMTDASDFAGGYVHPDATYNRKFTARERKAIIAVKEAKMISEAVEHNAEAWKWCVLPVYVDNSVCLHAFTRGRSRNKHINQLIRETLLTCAAYDVHPVFYFVYSTENTLADHVSRGALVEYEAALTWFCWPDTNRPLDQAPRETLLLSKDARDATAKYVSKATEASSMTTYQSGWNSWVQHSASRPGPVTAWQHILTMARKNIWNDCKSRLPAAVKPASALVRRGKGGRKDGCGNGGRRGGRAAEGGSWLAGAQRRGGR